LKATFEQAITFHREGKIEEAEHLYRIILKTQPEHLDANNNLGVILQYQGKLEQAKECYKKAIELNPDLSEAHNNLGNALKSLGKSNEAVKSYRKAIELKPDFSEAHNNLGNALKSLGKSNEAVKSYRKAIELKSDFVAVHNNLGGILQNQEKFNEAELSFKKAIEFKNDYDEAYNNLGVTLKNLGRIDEAEANYKKAIQLKPDYVEAYYNFGNLLKDLDRLKEAEKSYKKALELKPDFVAVHNNLGNIFRKQDRLDEAEASYKKAIELKPDHVYAHNNLGGILNNKGNLLAALDSYKQALNIQPDFAEAWDNVFFPLQAIKLQTSSVEDHLPVLKEQVTSKYAQAAKSILSYRLNLGIPSSESFLNKALSILSSADNTFIKNPKIPSSKLNIGSTPPKKITALVHFGRSGTGLLHSLIDGHSEVSTLPSIYFSEFFDHFSWEKIIAGGWEEMADRFTKTYAVLFDASSAIKIATISKQFIDNMGQKEGMTNVGTERDEVLSLDKKIFIKELNQLMNYHDRLDTFTFFKLVHSAYEKALQDHNEKKLIFYHIHNPDTYAQLNFLRLAPNTNWLMMVREPVQSCESWVRESFYNNNHTKIAARIFQMLFEVDNVIYRNENSIGVRLEDLKEHPKKTILALCDWLGIKEEDSLYQMTAQGKKWWGDKGSPDFERDGMNPFGKISINRKLGSVFSKDDQFIIQTLFYPFSVRFSYAEENLEQFKKDLQKIRPMLDQMFDFEKRIVQNKKMNTEKFMKSGTYLYLRSGMIERWNTLNKFHTYPKMLVPLKINQF
jgi:tetratricopeptide (TPR) repeat protein